LTTENRCKDTHFYWFGQKKFLHIKKNV
jgi:hypothetical protein